MSVEKNSGSELEFYVDTDQVETADDDNLSFDWFMELVEGDTVRLKETSGAFYCTSGGGCIFSGKFIREI